MIDQLSNALNFGRQALTLRADRQKVLANNIANADTPNYKARDFNFQQALAVATKGSEAAGSLPMATTSPRHLHGSANAGGGTGPQLMYRIPDQPSLDGNTVNMDVERAKFADNTIRYQASVTLLSGKIRGLKMAMQPEQ